MTQFELLCWPFNTLGLNKLYVFVDRTIGFLKKSFSGITLYKVNLFNVFLRWYYLKVRLRDQSFLTRSGFDFENWAQTGSGSCIRIVCFIKCLLNMEIIYKVNKNTNILKVYGDPHLIGLILYVHRFKNPYIAAVA